MATTHWSWMRCWKIVCSPSNSVPKCVHKQNRMCNNVLFTCFEFVFFPYLFHIFSDFHVSTALCIARGLWVVDPTAARSLPMRQIVLHRSGTFAWESRKGQRFGCWGPSCVAIELLFRSQKKSKEVKREFEVLNFTVLKSSTWKARVGKWASEVLESATHRWHEWHQLFLRSGSSLKSSRNLLNKCTSIIFNNFAGSRSLCISGNGSGRRFCIFGQHHRNQLLGRRTAAPICLRIQERVIGTTNLPRNAQLCAVKKNISKTGIKHQKIQKAWCYLPLSIDIRSALRLVREATNFQHWAVPFLISCDSSKWALHCSVGPGIQSQSPSLAFPCLNIDFFNILPILQFFLFAMSHFVSLHSGRALTFGEGSVHRTKLATWHAPTFLASRQVLFLNLLYLVFPVFLSAISLCFVL